jgi:hypothetical protein
MAYDGDPSASPIDAVRFWAQDTGDPPLLSDDEIDYLITFLDDPEVSPITVAAFVCDRIAAKYVGQVSISADGVSYSGDQLMQRYTTLAAELRKTLKRTNEHFAPPYVGGVLYGERALAGVRQPVFGVGMFDNPEGSTQDYGYLGELGEEETEPAGQVR